MNMTALSIVFGIIIGILSIALIVLGGMQVRIYRKRKEWEESKNDIKGPEPLEIKAEDVTIRVRVAEVEAYETPIEEPVTDEKAEEGIRINRSEKLNFEQKFAKLPEDKKALLQKFEAQFTAKPDCGKKLQANSLMFRYKKTQIAHATIRRDAVSLSFPLNNPELKRMVRAEKANSVKLKPVMLRLADENDLSAALQIADMTVEYVRDEDEYLNDQRKKARKEAARLRKMEAAVTSTSKT